MDKNGELREALKAIKNVVGDTSWFRDSPHYWAQVCKLRWKPVGNIAELGDMKPDID